jgi:hypothetical protein
VTCGWIGVALRTLRRVGAPQRTINMRIPTIPARDSN